MYVPFVGQNVTVALARAPSGGPSQFELRVDGKLLESATTDSTTSKNITIPYVGDGSHTLVVTKISEAMFGEALLTGVYVDGAGCAPTSQCGPCCSGGCFRAVTLCSAVELREACRDCSSLLPCIPPMQKQC